MHDRLLAALQNLTDVRLVASLRDDRLGFPDQNDLRVFVPDIHLISEKRRQSGGFTYASNNTELLTDVLTTLCTLKRNAAADETVAVYLLGDLLDLWRQTPKLDARVDAAAAIRDDHEDLMAAVLDPKLKARFLLGNHDFDLYRWPDYIGWDRRYYLPDSSLQAPSTIVLHGDVFDWIENFPDSLQQIMVYLMAPHLSANAYELGEMQKLIKKSHGQKKYQAGIRGGGPSPMGTLLPLKNSPPIPDRWNVQVPTSKNDKNPRLQFLSKARAEAKKANASYQMNLRVMFIGHTHLARIALHEKDGEFFALVDGGAWIEDCTWTENNQVMKAPNAQITAFSGNEVRIYQLG